MRDSILNFLRKKNIFVNCSFGEIMLTLKKQYKKRIIKFTYLILCYTENLCGKGIGMEI